MRLTIDNLAKFFISLYGFSVGLEFITPFGIDDSFSFAKLTGFLYIFIYLLFAIVHPGYALLNRRAIKFITPLMLLTMYLIVINYINASSSSSIIDISLLFNIFIVYVILCHGLKRNDHLESAMIAFSYSVIISSIMMLAGIGAETNQEGRITIFGQNHNELGIKIGVAATLILSRLVYKKDTNNIAKTSIGWMTVIILVLAMFSTGSRSAFVAFFLSTILVMYYSYKKDRRRGVAISVSAIFMGAAVYLFAVTSESFIDRLMISVETGLAGRVDIWEGYFCLFIDNIIFGLGHTGFENQAMKILGAVYSPHNAILEIGLYTGIIGLLLFGYFLGNVLYSGYKASVSKISVSVIAIVPFLLVMVLANQILNVKIFWLLCAYALVVGSSRMLRFHYDCDELRNVTPR